MSDYDALVGDSDSTLGEFATEILGDDDSLGANLAEMDGDDDSLGANLAEMDGDDLDGDDVDGDVDGDLEGDDVDGDVTPIGDLLEGDDEAGAWLHKLNPAYWIKSKRQKQMIDTEKQAWIDNAAANKRKAKQEQELAAAQRALVAKQAAKASSEESAAIESQMQDIESSLSSGAFVGTFVGDEDSLGAVVAKAKKTAGQNKKVCAAFADKIEKGEKLTPEEMKLLRSCLKTTDMLRKLHRRLHAMDVPGATATTPAVTTAGYHEERGSNSTYLGDNPTEILGGEFSSVFSGSFVGGRKYPQAKWMQMSALAAVEPKKLPVFMKKNGIMLDRVQQGHLKQLTTMTRKALVKQTLASPAAKAAGRSWPRCGP